MTFEEALIVELDVITDLNHNIFPLCTPKDQKAPYLVFRKVGINYRKTLSGTSNKVEGTYDISVLSKSYAQLQQITNAVTSKLLSFQNRYIGTNGPGIENITVSLIGDSYEPDVDLFRANMSVSVNY